jgi:hypothetical protein
MKTIHHGEYRGKFIYIYIYIIVHFPKRSISAKSQSVFLLSQLPHRILLSSITCLLIAHSIWVVSSLAALPSF